MTHKSDEARIGDAIASLATRLTHWGVTQPHQRAGEYIHEMMRHGWRPTGPDHTPPPDTPGNPSTNPQAHIDAARAALRAARHKPPTTNHTTHTSQETHP